MSSLRCIAVRVVHSIAPFPRGPLRAPRESIPRFRHCLVALLGFALIGREASAGFITAPTYPVGLNPVAVAVGDFNGDGIPDVAVANESVGPIPGAVTIVLGKGDGTFLAGRSHPLGSSSPSSLEVEDFNGDGILDIAVADPGSNNGAVWVLLGNGDGSFQAANPYSAGQDAVSLALGDFNGDGYLDIVVANRDIDRGEVTVLLGNGDGAFQSARTYPAGTAPQSVAVGDFNGDGILDLAVANFPPNAPYVGTVSVLLGNGDGSFNRPQSYAVGAEPIAVAVGDFNGDGIPDLAVIDKEGLGNGLVAILLGKGDGTFQAAEDFAIGPRPSSIGVGDLNGDGHLDLVTVDIAGVSIWLGQGDGKFQAAQTYNAGAGPNSVAVADFNQDGHSDLAVANLTGLSGEGGTVSVLLGKGDGSVQAAPNYAIGQGYPRSMAIGDFNGDGIPDVAAANDGGASGSLVLFFGNGNGTFRAGGSLSTGPGPVAVSVADFNGDGKQDILITNHSEGNPPRNPGPRISGVRIYLGNGDGTFQKAFVYKSDLGSKAAAIGDFNGDGIPDLAVANYGWYENGGNTVSILLGKGDGTFQAGPTFPVASGPNSVAVADFNGDGKLDLAVAADTGLSLLLGNGDGTFQAAQNYSLSGYCVAVGDFNADGNLDLAIAAGFNPNGTVSVLLGNGDGTFRAPHTYRVGFYPLSIVVGDFNGDGVLDLAVTNRDSGTVSVLLGKGDGSFLDRQDFSAGTDPVALTTVDFDGDGYLDLAVTNFSSDTVTILINDGYWPP